MKFAQSYWGFGFWIVVALGVFFIWAFKDKKKMMQRFAVSEILKEIASCVDFKKQKIKIVIKLAVLALGIFALMRPQWGFSWQEVKRKGIDILIAVDTSKSMLAKDVKPNRLEKSKLAIKDLVKKLRGDRVGLIAFSGTSFLQCPLTIDYGGFLLALEDLNTSTIPRGGTSISSAIKSALDGFGTGESKHKALIIITDGEEHEGDSIKLASLAKKEGLKIFCIGIGTTEGELIQVKGQDGKVKFLKNKEGNVIKSRLNEKVLQDIALATGGLYVRSSGAQFGLDLIYDKRLMQMEKKEIEAKMAKFYHERFQIPLTLALILFVVVPFINEKKKQ